MQHNRTRRAMEMLQWSM